ncbi:MAG: ATP-binding protein, partial [Lachnospiraceae bacterium]|nr:ATP-binding protein [Lachnospiraceae bacterium]
DPGEVTVRLDFTEQITEVKMTIMDCGIPYDPLKRPDPDVSLEAEARQIGGLGIYMVKQMMEEVSYEYRGGMNILRMRKMF